MLHLFIVNPLSVGQKILQKWETIIRNACEKRGVRYEIYCAKAPEDGARYATQKAKEERALRLYACGGDGTVGELAGVAVREPHLQLCCLPFGTGNDFIRNFGKKQDFFDIEALLDGQEEVVDAISWNGNICANISNIGFDRDVVIRVSKLRKLPFMTRSIAYTIGLVIELFRFAKEKVTIECDEGRYSGKVSLALAANGQYYGGGYRAAGRASLTDGKMDVLVVRPISRLKFLTLVGDYKNGKILENKRAKPYIEYWQTEAVAFYKEGAPLYLCVDGEIHEVERAELKILPGALRFVRPAKNKKETQNETLTRTTA